MAEAGLVRMEAGPSPSVRRALGGVGGRWAVFGGIQDWSFLDIFTFSLSLEERRTEGV